MSKPLSFILILFAIALHAQTERSVLRGMVYIDSVPAVDVNLINSTSKRGTITNSQGEFSIYVKPGDILRVSSVQTYTIFLKVQNEEFIDNDLILYLNAANNELDEVFLRKSNNMAKSLGLPNAGKEPLEKIDRKLNMYSQEKTAIVILGALIGQKGGISDLYNIISGNRKRDRKLKAYIEQDKLIEKNEIVLSEIREHFTDDFFISQLGIKSDNIDSFLQNCLHLNIVELYEKGNYLKLTDVLIKKSQEDLIPIREN